MTISIRLATTADSNLLHQMICDLARYENEGTQCESYRRRAVSTIGSATPSVRVCNCGVRWRAMCFALYFYAYSTWEGTRTLYLEDLYVCPKFRGSGAGGCADDAPGEDRASAAM